MGKDTPQNEISPFGNFYVLLSREYQKNYNLPSFSEKNYNPHQDFPTPPPSNKRPLTKGTHS